MALGHNIHHNYNLFSAFRMSHANKRVEFSSLSPSTLAVALCSKPKQIIASSYNSWDYPKPLMVQTNYLFNNRTRIPQSAIFSSVCRRISHANQLRQKRHPHRKLTTVLGLHHLHFGACKLPLLCPC